MTFFDILVSLTKVQNGEEHWSSADVSILINAYRKISLYPSKNIGEPDKIQ